MIDHMLPDLTMLAAGEGAGALREALTAVVALFAAALAVGWVMRALRLPTILGFLIAGILIGPSVLDVIHHGKVLFFAELGLTLLLFTIGLELSPGPLLRMGGRLLVAAGLQIVLITAVTAVGLRWGLNLSWVGAVIGGVGVSLSSTAIVLKHLSERGEISSPGGALTTGILLVQDIVVILVLIVLPFMAGARGETQPAATSLWLKIVLALGGLVAVTFVARLAMPVIVKQVFRFGSQELMTLFAIVMACTGAWLASLAEWSWPLGSFIAGLLIAQTDMRHQLRAEIQPFRDAFNALFFISIGMLVDLSVVAEHAWPLLVVILLTLFLKTVLTGASVLVGGWPLRMALVAGLGLCTISEFGYVLVSEADRLEMIRGDFMPVFVAWAVGTMLLGAVLVPFSAPLAATIAGWLQPAGVEKKGPEIGAAHGHGVGLGSHVIIVGYGINGQNLARVLRAVRIPYAVVEMQPTTARKARMDAEGVPVFVGDAARMTILEEAGLHAARVLVVAIADQDATRRIVAQAHRARPELYILARTRFITELQPLYRVGARFVIPEEFETSIEIFAHVLKEFGVPDNVIDQQVKMIRAGQYGMLRGRLADRTMQNEWLTLLEAAVTQTYLVQEGSLGCGKTFRELDLRARTGVTVVAVTRAGKPVPNPDPDFKLAAGDVLVLVGAHKPLDEARALLDPPESEVT